jgi:hypothetical protein
MLREPRHGRRGWRGGPRELLDPSAAQIFFEATLRIMSPRANRSDRFRKRAILCVALGVALAALAAERIVNDAYVELRAGPEPAGWREWPVLSDLDGYRFSDDHGGCGLNQWSNEVLNDDRGLLPRGISLDVGHGADRAWPEDRTGDPSALSVRGAGEMRVVTVTEPRSSTDTFVVAFERGAVSHSLGFHHPGSEGFVVFVVAALTLLLGSAVVSAHYLAASRAFRDPSRFRPALRDAFNTIVFHDDTPPIALGNHASRRASPGPVLVRVTKVEPGTYRSPPTTHARSILDGDAQSLSLARRGRVASALWVALVASLFLLFLAVFVASDPCWPPRSAYWGAIY